MYADVVVITDHKPLTFLKQNHDMMSVTFNKWFDILDNFDFQIKYLKGEVNTLPDKLSRLNYEENVCHAL